MGVPGSVTVRFGVEEVARTREGVKEGEPWRLSGLLDDDPGCVVGAICHVDRILAW